MNTETSGLTAAQARKRLYDWLDRSRPWATHKCMYVAMESIVDMASECFIGRPADPAEDLLNRCLNVMDGDFTDDTRAGLADQLRKHLGPDPPAAT